MDPFPRGDLNCDGNVGLGDVDAFVLALVNRPAYNAAHPDCGPMLADVNADGSLNGLDIDAFISLLIGR